MEHIGNVLERILSRVRVCAGCGRILFHPNKIADGLNFVCKSCNVRLLLSKNHRLHKNKKLNCFHLYSWHNRNEQMIRNILMGLKGGGPDKIYLDVAEKLISQRSLMCQQILGDDFLTRLSKRRVIFIPAPGKNKTLRDHAESLAHALACFCDARYLPCLERVDRQEQKARGRSERARHLRVRLKESSREAVSRGIEEATFIFVDDVITTGKTAQDAFEALNEPKQFEVWTIFYRLRLRP